MKKRRQKTLVLLCITAALLSLCLPIFSVSGQQILRGYDMLGLSAFGVLVGLSIVLLLLITVYPLPYRLQRVMLLIALIPGIFCYIEAAWFARLWLQWNNGAFVYHHYGLVVYPQIMFAAVTVAWKRTGGNHV